MNNQAFRYVRLLISRVLEWHPAVLLFVVVSVVYGLLVSLPFPKGMDMTTGDEPHYLLYAHSLYYDHDWDLVNNYQNGDYVPFHSLEVLGRQLFNYKGRLIPLHPLLGLPLLILPGYAIGGRIGVLLVLCFVTAYGITQLFKASQVGVPRWIAFTTVAFAALTYPVVIYSEQIYPETVAFAIVAFALAAIMTVDRSHSLHGVALLVGCMLAVLPHLHYKFLLLMLTLYAYYLYRGRDRLGECLRWSLGPIVLSLMLFGAWIYVVFGELTPGVFLAPLRGTYLDANPAAGIVGLLFDQEYGLFLYAPFYLLSLSGWWSMWRNNRFRADSVFLALVYVSYHLMVASSWDWMGGLSPVPRYLVPVLPVLVILSAHAVATQWERRQWLLPLLLGLGSAGMTILILQNRLLMFGFETGVNPVLRSWNARSLIDSLPVFTKGQELSSLPRLAMLLAVLVMLWFLTSFLNQLVTGILGRKGSWSKHSSASESSG